MANLKPFKGLRPAKELASRVAALPYDVLNSEEARLLAQGNPYSFFHISKAEIDLEPGTDPHTDSVYAKSQANFRQFIADGILCPDPKPCYYLYRQIMPLEGREHVQTGIVAGASVKEYKDNTIRKHEQTRQDKEDDRTRHVNDLNANTGPVFLTYLARPAIDALTAKIMQSPPENDFTADDGIRHTLWVVAGDADIEAIRTEFQKVDIMYVADGHHRSAAAARVCDLRTAALPQARSDEEFDFFLAVIFPHNQMQIMAYNRVVKDLNGLTPEEFLNRVSAKFEIEPRTEAKFEPSDKHSFGLYLEGKWYKITPRAGLVNETDAVASLDVSILQDNLLAPVLGINNPRTDKRIDFVGGIRGVSELVKLVDSGKFKVAFALYPTSIEDLITVAEQGKFMPPKSTWFEPKLRSGLVIHQLQ